jgi:hypothetical protein
MQRSKRSQGGPFKPIGRDQPHCVLLCDRYNRRQRHLRTAPQTVDMTPHIEHLWDIASIMAGVPVSLC